MTKFQLHVQNTFTKKLSLKCLQLQSMQEYDKEIRDKDKERGEDKGKKVVA